MADGEPVDDGSGLEVLAAVIKRPPPKREKAAKKDKQAKKAKKKDKQKKEGKEKKRKASVLDSSSSDAGVQFYRGRQCKVLALSYETETPHAIVRTSDGREFGVEMSQLTKEPQPAQSKKKKKQKKDKEGSSKRDPLVLTIDDSSSSASVPGGEGQDGAGSGGKEAEGAALGAGEDGGQPKPEGEEPTPGQPRPEGEKPAPGQRPEGEEPAPGQKPEGEEPAPGQRPEGEEPAPGQGQEARTAELPGTAPEGAEQAQAAGTEARGEASAKEQADLPGAGRRQEGEQPQAEVVETEGAAKQQPQQQEPQQVEQEQPSERQLDEPAKDQMAQGQSIESSDEEPQVKWPRTDPPAPQGADQEEDEAKQHELKQMVELELLKARRHEEKEQRRREQRQRELQLRREQRKREKEALERARAEPLLGPPPAPRGPEKGSPGGPRVFGAPESERRMLESALYQEDVLEFGHSEVWGSWFDIASQRWGYRCCQGLSRADECTAVSLPQAPEGEQAAGAGVEAADALDEPPIIARSGLASLQPRESFADAVDFVVQWVQAVLFDWREGLHAGLSEVMAHARFGSCEQLAEAERAVAPLLRLLQACSSSFSLCESVQVWSVGNNRWMNGKVIEVLAVETVVTGSKTAADGNQLPAGSILVSFSSGEARKWVAANQTGTLLRKAQKVELSKEAIEGLESIALLSSEREYNRANQAYIELTVGHGKWHGDLSISGLTGCNKAPRNGFKVRKDTSNFLDTEEAKVYMFCLKRLVAFSQLIRPNPDVSKHFT